MKTKKIPSLSDDCLFEEKRFNGWGWCCVWGGVGGEFLSIEQFIGQYQCDTKMKFQ